MSSSGTGQEQAEEPHTLLRRVHAEEMEGVLADFGEDLKVLFGALEVDEAAAVEQVLEALLAVSARGRGTGDLRLRLLECVGRAAHGRWKDRNFLEEDDAVH